eukprot:440770_1
MALCRLHRPVIDFILFSGLLSVAISEGWSDWIGYSGSTDDEVTLETTDPTAYITKMCIKQSSDDDICEFEAWFSNNEHDGPIGGSSSDDWSCFEVPNTECFRSIYGLSGTRIDAIQVLASDGSQSTLPGSTGGDPYTIDSTNTHGCISRLRFKREKRSTDVFRWIRAYFIIVTESPTRTPTVAPSISSTSPTQTSSTLSPSVLPSVSPSDLYASVVTNTMKHDTTTLFSPRNENAGDVPIITTNLYILIPSLCFACICVCVVGILYRKKVNAPRKRSDVKPNQPTNERVVSVSDEEIQAQHVPECIDNKEERMKIKEWMTNQVKLHSYYDILIDNGYDKMEFILDIKSSADLEEIGFNLKGHQLRMLSEIEKYKKTQMSVDYGPGSWNKGQVVLDDKKDVEGGICVIEDALSSTSVESAEGMSPQHTVNNECVAVQDMDVDSIKIQDDVRESIVELNETIC